VYAKMTPETVPVDAEPSDRTPLEASDIPVGNALPELPTEKVPPVATKPPVGSVGFRSYVVELPETKVASGETIQGTTVIVCVAETLALPLLAVRV
jgi:hypothetical protein